ncbi:unnamed protein product [Rhizophagus irregularis]|nr:unnamed protein product [Rhizophagus irregularis]
MKTLYVFILAIAVLLYVDALPYIPSKIVTIPLKEKRITRRKPRKFDRRDTTNVEVDQQHPDIAYFGELFFGDSKFDIQFDTGSADLWVIDDACLSPACDDKNRYDPETDEDFQDLHENFNAEYDKGTVTGTQGTTIVQIGDLSIRQKFGLAVTLTNDFQRDEFDGMMGMAFNVASQNDQITLISNLFNDNNNHFDAQQFSFKLGRDADGTEGELTIGGVNSESFTGELTWTGLSENNGGLWIIPLDDCLVNGAALNLAGRIANLDTGTTLIVVPHADAQQVYANIQHEEKNGHFYISCDVQVTISMRINGATWNIDQRDFIIEDGDECYGAIDGTDDGPANEWILGAAFLKNVYSVFDLGGIQIGLGQLA